MQSEKRKPSEEETGVVVPFPTRKPASVHAFSNLSKNRSPVEGVDKYAKRGSEKDDYAHRMKMNAVAIVFLAGLVFAGVWIMDIMAQQRKTQDCALSGRRNCAPISTQVGGG